MSLTVNVKSASSLPNVEKFSLSDPYAILIFQNKKQKTKVIDNNLDPEWNETFTWTMPAALAPSDQLLVEVYDYEKIGRKRLLGKTAIPLHQVSRSGKLDSSFALTGKDGSPTAAKINLGIVYQAPAGAAGAGDKGAAVAGGGGDGDAEEGGGDLNEEGGEVVGGGGEEEEGDAEGGTGDAAAGGAGGSTAGRKTSKKKSRKSAARAKLPNKPTDFQIRFHVIEARKLPGGNLKPVVKVQCGSVVKGTSVQKGTNNPIFDEMLIFQTCERPEEFLDSIIDIKVLNSRQLLKDAMIGSFKFDVGLVYDEPGHAIIHKWLLLTDPEDVTSEAKGYLKMTINVLGPGDEPASSRTSLDDEDVDIEANLLRPSGVRLQAATVSVKVFRAEDLPQMDSEFLMKVGKLFGGDDQKELVDPYCTVNYAGHEGSTPKIMENMNPEWNTQINLGVRMPSMCERLRLTLKDYDRTSRDDYIGTGFLRMSAISAPGENGFLPTFGPAFINIYGSPREFTNLPDKYEYLNMGKIEGVSYRGRVMIEVGVDVGNFPTSKKEDIKAADLERILPFLRRRKYKLYAAFLHATAVKPDDKPIEFEISIGNYGNKLDKFVPDTTSTTQSSNPVYDGNHYHYLPWFSSKPCVQVESHWEDNTYRIGSLNIMLSMCRQLEAGLSRCKALMAMRTYSVEDLKGTAAEMLGNLITHLEQPFPKLPEKNVTQLDLKMRSFREEERLSMVDEARNLRPLLVKPEEVVDELDGILQRLRNIAYEPQITVPDVIIWMLAGKNRVACKRIPAHRLMYAAQQMQRGELCGTIQTIELEPPAVEKDEDLADAEGQAQLRLVLWLGLERDAARWTEHIPDGQVAVYAETYEHQAALLGRWGTTALVVKNFSDAKGKRKLEKDAFVAPQGWSWDGDWFINPEISAAFEADSGRKEFQEEVYEYQYRVPFTSFEKADSTWRDVRNADLEEGMTKDTFPARKGWQWITEWEMDVNRAVDDGAWQYAIDSEQGPWVSSERTIHVSRRRRWVRTRQRLEDAKKEESKLVQRQKSITEGWEYARTVFSSYHISEHKLDFARRRRWHRKLVQVSGDNPPVFYFDSEKKKKKKKDDDDDDYTQAPRMYLIFPDEACHKYQLRAYIYQARDMHGSDESGLSDPYAFVSFNRYSQTTRIMKQTVCPTWDQTIILDEILLFGNPASVLESPPKCMVEFYDRDQIGKDEYLGMCTATPVVRLDIKSTPQPRLQWYDITRYRKYGGELLAAFELLFLEDGDLPFPPPKAPKGDHFQVPAGIRPVLQKTRIEVLCWGVRDMKKYQLLPVNSPLVELECGGHIQCTTPIKNAKENPNFPVPVVVMDVNIPKEPLYAPPLNIRIMDKRAFGRKPAVGMHIVKTLRDFHCDPKAEAKAFASAAKAVMTQLATLKRLSTLTELPSPLSTQQPPSPVTEKHPVISPQPISIEEGSPKPPSTGSPKPPSTGSPKPPSTGSPKPKPSPAPATKDEALLQEDDQSQDEPVVGTMPLPEPIVDEVAIKMEDEALIAGADPDITKDSDFDWWTKFYTSIGDEQRKQPEYEAEGMDKLVVYNNPLETFFGNFEDIATTYPLFRGKCQRDADDSVEHTVGKLKGAIKVCPFPTDGSEPPQMFGNIPPTQPVECVVRVYVVQAMNLQPKDPNGKSDPFLKLRIGKKKINDQDNFIPNNLNPIFGRVYELPANLPIDHTLKITVMDYDRTSANDLIGETTIDLENRYLTKYKALCGLPETFSIRGLNNWRNTQLPRDMLNEFCLARGLPEPRWNGMKELIIDNRLYRLDTFEPNDTPPHLDVGPEDQRLALHVLRQQGLVPEHVETRPLYNKLQPDIEQGRLQMWVDIFPKVTGIPPSPVDITPRKPKKYTLRVVVYNTKDVELDEVSVVTGEAMSDIYVKGWFQGQDETQKTDVHYRSLDGEGNFNWRLVFPFEYIPQEKVMVVRKKEHFFSLDKTERRLPPRFTIQVWDNDLFNPDDFIGTIDFKLDQIPRPKAYADKCDLDQLLDWNHEAKWDDLFKKKRIKGWWPVYSDKFGKENREVKGKVELELEVVTEEEELEKPAAKAREEPNMNPFLPEPNRPATSFLWFTSPWKTFKMIIWKHYKWHIIGTILGILIVLILAIVIYTLPNQLGMWMMSSLLPG